MSDDDAFLQRQRAHFARADGDHFRWQTEHPLLRESERRLLGRIAARVRPPFVEVGCGEGANLRHFGAAAAGAIGVDWSQPKVDFARRAIPGLRGICASAEALPLSARRFETVLIRDLLHHVRDPARAIRQAAALLRTGGHLLLIEPNGRNPLVATFAWSATAERGMLASTPARLRRLITPPLSLVAFEMHQPLPLARAVCHYRWGWPSLAHRRCARLILDRFEGLFRRCLPESRWAYMVLVLRREEDG